MPLFCSLLPFLFKIASFGITTFSSIHPPKILNTRRGKFTAHNLSLTRVAPDHVSQCFPFPEGPNPKRTNSANSITNCSYLLTACNTHPSYQFSPHVINIHIYVPELGTEKQTLQVVSSSKSLIIAYLVLVFVVVGFYSLIRK